MRVNRYALSVCAALLLAGCGGSQPPGNSIPAATLARNSRSPLTRGAGDLLYVLTPFTSHGADLIMYSFPGGKRVRSFYSDSPFESADRMCSDTSGNVWFVTGLSGGRAGVVEFAHGGDSPIATLIDPPSAGTPNACAVDPRTGNLALATGPYIAVYAQARGNPKYYTVPNIQSFYGCAYDAWGNLLVGGVARAPIPFAFLAYGHSSFTKITVNHKFNEGSFIQWDGKRLGHFG